MKKKPFAFMGFLLAFVLHTGLIFADEQLPSGDGRADESRPGSNDMGLQSALSKLKLAGGISGGYFYASNPGEDISGSEFLLSNLLVEIFSTDETLPIGFAAGFGGTSTPSVLDTPENSNTLNIEYAYLTLSPVTNVGLEVGLLMPNAGFEDTYTYNNKNILNGAVASQQPYNAYGARLSYDMDGLSMWGGYYTERLDNEEYNSSDEAWEIGVDGSFSDNDISLYHYHIGGRRSLTGMVIERAIQEVDMGINIDYWTWDSSARDAHGSDSSIGGAVYVCPSFGNVSIPIRLEYVHQQESRIYVENADVKIITTATITPTYHYSENAYIRAEAAYVNADGTFEGENGNRKDERISLAMEAGFLF